MLDASLSVSLAGLSRDQSRPWAGSPKRAISWVAGLGARFIQLDAAAPGFRARELDRSARRDLAASLRRAELELGGLDLWIPQRHFVDDAEQGRALDAVLGAIALAADLASLGVGRGVLSVHTPAAASEDLLASIAYASERDGVPVADHLHPPRETATLGVGVDPAVALMAGDDPIDVAVGSASRLASARFSDAGPAGRVPPGSGHGQLDIDAYVATLSTTGLERPIVIDLRGLGDAQESTARDLINRYGA